MKKLLTPKQKRFVAEYLVDLNATRAAERAGYSHKTARQQGSRLLINVDIAAAVSAGQAKQLGKASLTAVRVLDELSRLALVDMRGFWDECGNLKPIHELSPDQGACLAGVEVIRRKNGEDWDDVHKIKLWDKPRSLEILARHFGLVKATVDVPGLQELAASLARKCVDEIHPGPTKGQV